MSGKKLHLSHIFLSLLSVSKLVLCNESAGNPLVVGVTPGEMDLASRILQVMPGWNEALDLREIYQDVQLPDYDQLQKVNKHIREDSIHAVIGHYDHGIAMVTEKHEVPYLVTDLVGNISSTSIFKTLPYPHEVASVFVDIMEAYKWERIAIIFEEGFGSQFVDGLIRHCELKDCTFWRVSAKYQEDEVRKALLAVRQKNIQRILCLTIASHSQAILHQGRRLGMAAEPHSWLLLDLDTENAATNILKDLKANVTSINFIKSPVSLPGGTPEDSLQVAGLCDALEALVIVHRKGVQTSRQISHTLKSQETLFVGKTGEVQFNNQGERTRFAFDIYNCGLDTFKKVGYWHSDTTEKRLNMTTPEVIVRLSSVFPLLGKKFRVVSILEKPFFMLKSDHESRTGNDRFEGFAVDMMEEISKILLFDYEMYIVPDGNFGVEIKNGEWNGMIGQVLNGNASMSMAPLSINALREEAIDFTKPFKTRGITVLMKTPAQQSSFFQFLKPLSFQVWACTLLAIIVISLILVALEKYCIICRHDMPKLTLKEGFWFIIGSVVSGSTESTPVTVPGRILTSAWWFFALILVSTYTANLAAFLTVKKIHPPISDVTDLAEQSKIKFGTVRNSGVMTFFKQTNIQPFAKMWTHMNELNPDSMVNTTTEGFRRVKEGNYAFLWDSSVTSYYANVDCDYTEIGPPFDPKGFGMATPPGAQYTNILSMAILQLGDRGTIASLENKYWGQGDCPDLSKPATDETSELQLENVAGIFFVLIGGIAIALISSAVDRFISWKRNYNVNNPENQHETISMQQKLPSNSNSMKGFI